VWLPDMHEREGNETREADRKSAARKCHRNVYRLLPVERRDTFSRHEVAEDGFLRRELLHCLRAKRRFTATDRAAFRARSGSDVLFGFGLG
jgi:hypothetical protein